MGERRRGCVLFPTLVRSCQRQRLSGDSLWAIEVKSGRPARAVGLAAFLRLHSRAVPVVIGTGGLPFDELFATDPRELLPRLLRR